MKPDGQAGGRDAGFSLINYDPLVPTIFDLVQRFKDTYHNTWIIERHGYPTPAEVRAAQLGQIPLPFERKTVSHFCGPLQGSGRS